MKFIHKLEIGSDNDLIEVNGVVFRLVGFAFPSNVPFRVEFQHVDDEKAADDSEFVFSAYCDYGRIW